ncbi:MAG: glycosyltransferase [Magnetococcales bacterium]|nr:glycosyltransferase [Magnetococcales bacterium]
MTMDAQGLLLQAPQPGGGGVYVAERFRFFFSLDGSKSAPADPTDTDGDGVPDFVATQMRRLREACDVFIRIMGIPDFLAEGHLWRQGVRYVDVVLDDIPVLRGLSSSKVAETTPAFLRGSGHEGRSVTLKLHRALAATSLTPAHELFHLFQYATLPLLNLWFSEGLARHAQRWLADKRPVSTPLPQTREELEALLRLWHEAEPFWNRLGELCDPEPVAPVEPAPVNPCLAGQRFLGALFPHASRQMERMRVAMPGRKLPEDGQWPTAEKRSGGNNRYILRAVCAAVRELAPPANPELEGFVALVRNLDDQAQALALTPEVRGFLRTLRRHGLAEVRAGEDGALRCDAYEAMTGTLSIPEIRFPAGAFDQEELDCWRVVRHVIGSLALENQPALVHLEGLEALAAVEGNLTIAGIGAERLEAILPALERVKGSVRIGDNPCLRVFSGCDALQSIDNALEIVGHPRLITVTGFSRLREIKKGELILKESPELERIQGFAGLQDVQGVLLERLGLREVDFLGPFFAKHPEFAGPIRLVYCRLESIQGLAGLRRAQSSFYLHGNALADLSPLSQLTWVGASLSLSGNRLRDLRPLSRLTGVEGMLGLMNNRLASLEGLENLRLLKTVRWNQERRTLVIQGNPSLRDISALRNLVTRDGEFILYCDAMSQYTGLPAESDRFFGNRLKIHEVNRQRVASQAGPATISVVVIGFDIARYVERTLQSVLRQTSAPEEIVFVDDGSGDGTPAMARDILQSFPAHRVLEQANKGPGGARNAGLESASGEYVLFLDGDDWLDPRALEIFRQHLRERPDAVFANRTGFNEETGVFRPESTFDQVSVGKVGPGRCLLRRFAVTGKIFRRNFLIENQLFFPENMIWEDYVFSYGVLGCAASITVIEDLVYFWTRRARQGDTLSVTQQSRLSEFALASRFKQIETCRQLVRDYRLGEKFPGFNFDAREFDLRLWYDIRYLERERDPESFERAFAAYRAFLARHEAAILSSVSRPVRQVYQCLLAGDKEGTLRHIRSA